MHFQELVPRLLDSLHYAVREDESGACLENSSKPSGYSGDHAPHSFVSAFRGQQHSQLDDRTCARKQLGTVPLENAGKYARWGVRPATKAHTLNNWKLSPESPRAISRTAAVVNRMNCCTFTNLPMNPHGYWPWHANGVAHSHTTHGNAGAADKATEPSSPADELRGLPGQRGRAVRPQRVGLELEPLHARRGRRRGGQPAPARASGAGPRRALQGLLADGGLQRLEGLREALGPAQRELIAEGGVHVQGEVGERLPQPGRLGGAQQPLCPEGVHQVGDAHLVALGVRPAGLPLRLRGGDQSVDTRRQVVDTLLEPASGDLVQEPPELLHVRLPRGALGVQEAG
mmetsp:Transcript_39098/g.104914  ORF Transcript_39098/g.104914 Transcript_39098/m.104914 type:complete len:344 (+) Transcript_39098:469-1500(+)